jgi:hypothetical protein
MRFSGLTAIRTPTAPTKIALRQIVFSNGLFIPSNLDATFTASPIAVQDLVPSPSEQVWAGLAE